MISRLFRKTSKDQPEQETHRYEVIEASDHLLAVRRELVELAENPENSPNGKGTTKLYGDDYPISAINGVAIYFGDRTNEQLQNIIVPPEDKITLIFVFRKRQRGLLVSVLKELREISLVPTTAILEEDTYRETHAQDRVLLTEMRDTTQYCVKTRWNQ